MTATPETKENLHQSILLYLHRSGFSKTLKRFQSEAQIQNDSWKASSANLEEIYSKYVNDSSHIEDVKDEKTIKSKKKTKSNTVEDQSKSTMSNGEIPKDNVVVEESETKPKKKKSKHDLASGDEAKKAKSDDAINVTEVNELKKKPKGKKKKSQQEDKPATNDAENGDVDPDVTKEDKKSSKKRKRLLSDENEQKTEAPKEDDVDDNEKSEINGGEKSQKSLKKQRIDSEPKTINAFQRVKIDEVEFAHEKLQDNSYWAKDGADVGYGAKAQEVLGLVRGKGFRHEKTKKKRGSYRGGQIDLHSHSIKFNYSDEE